MRGAFIQTLTELAAQDERIVLLTADLGFTVLEEFAQEFPRRFYNVGVAEQNMAGMATGLAEAGLIPFIYSIGTFASLRGYEFIRNGAVLHHFPVRIVAVCGGLEYSTAGMTHSTLEDIAVMRAQVGLRVVAPADGAQTRQALLSTWHLPDPIYYRIGKNDKLVIPGLDGQFSLNTPTLLGDGKSLLIAVTGSVTSEVVQAVEQLSQMGIKSTVAVFASLNPTPDCHDLLKSFRHVMTVEDHYINGGLGSLVAEQLAEAGIGARLLRCGVTLQPDGITGSLAFLRKKYGLSAAQLAARAQIFVENR